MSNLQQAIAYHREGQLQEAEDAYRSVIKAQPRNADAWSLLGVVLEARGATEEAVKSIQKAASLDPKAPLFKFHLGNALLAHGKINEAVAALRQAANMLPQVPEAHYNLGNALEKAGDGANAIAAWRKALALNPALHLARNNIALQLVAEKKYAEAVQELSTIVNADPTNLKAWIDLSSASDKAEDFAIARMAAEKAVALAPDFPETQFILGLSHIRSANINAAIEAFEKVTKLDPDAFGAWDNYAQCLQAADRYDEAEIAYQKALSCAPYNADTNYHNALFQLLRGDLKNGFENYRWRFEAVEHLNRIKNPAPVWNGEDVKGKTILVADEQGFGDSLMFCRYLPLLKARGARVIYACLLPLQALLKGWHGADEFITMQDAATYPCDAHAMMMDLPRWLGTDAATLSGSVPYIAPPPADAALPESLSVAGLKVGLVHVGKRTHKHDHRRSIPLSTFSTILGVAGVEYYSLLRPEDLRDNDAEILAEKGVHMIGHHIVDFSDTARYMQALDLVISVDTSSVHLAGALGRPVWVLLATGNDWRWQEKRTDSPWYPTAKLYRQSTPNDWAEVLEHVRQDLQNQATAHKS